MSRRPQVLAGVALLCVAAVVLVSTDGLSQSLQLGTSSGNAVPGTMSLSVRSRRYKYRFYIYEELNNVAPTSKSIFKAGCGYTCLLYVCITAPLYKLARNHPARTHNASEATLFIVPFSVEGSYYGGQCDGRSHHDRLNLVIRFLKASPHFRAKKGANHFWPILFWMFGRDGFGFFQNDAITKGGALEQVIFGRYQVQRGSVWESAVIHKDPEVVKEMNFVRGTSEYKYDYRSWRSRAVLVPIASTSFGGDETFQEWMKRPNMFHFRGSLRDCWTQRQRDHIEHVVGKIVNNSTMGRRYANTPGAYVNELRSHKFCFVLRCDELETSRFIDSMAENCIPITPSDGWRLQTAAFWERLNYDSFTWNIPWSMWDQDPAGTINWIISQPDFVYEEMWKSFQRARRILLWSHPKTETLDWVLHDVADRAVKPPKINRPLRRLMLINDTNYTVPYIEPIE